MSKQSKKRWPVGSRVLAGVISRQPGTVQSVADNPGSFGEYLHEVLIDSEKVIQQFFGSELDSLGQIDEDFRSERGTTVYIQNSNVANLNVVSQVGTINTALQTIFRGDTSQKEFAQALEQLTQAVLGETALQDVDKREVMDALSTIAEQAAKPPQEQSKGILKAAVTWLPTAVSAARSLTELWETVGPIIKGHLGIG
jgi:hypothetical protein